MPNIFILCLALILSACSKTESIQVAGSSTVLPVVSVAAEIYAKKHPGVSIIVNGGGSGVGVNQLGSRRIQIGMISREISSDEIKNFPNTQFVSHVIGHDAVVPVLSSEVYNSGVTALSLKQIAAIYMGEINNWKELGGPDREILVIDKEKSRGTRHVFMQAIMHDKHAITPGSDLILGSNNEEQTAIAQSDAAIGMLSRAWLNDDVKGLALITGNNQTIAASLENIANGRYPINRNLILITNGEPAGTIARFIDFILSPEGQEIVKQAGYIGS